MKKVGNRQIIFFTFSEQTSIGYKYQALNDLIAELAKNVNFKLHTSAFRDKQRIVIRRSVKEAELFDQMPSRNGEFWELLLCHGGNIVDKFFVIATKNGCTQSTNTMSWYPRCLIKSLLLVSAVLLAYSICLNE